MDLIQVISAWGPPGAFAGLIYIMLGKSEKREAQKDLRIQLLENKLTESYDERVATADQVSKALHDNSVAITALTHEIRATKNA